MIKETYNPASRTQIATSLCRHHWIIEAPVGPLSDGACRRCGEVRKFKNYIEDTSWLEARSADKPE